MHFKRESRITGGAEAIFQDRPEIAGVECNFLKDAEHDRDNIVRELDRRATARFVKQQGVSPAVRQMSGADERTQENHGRDNRWRNVDRLVLPDFAQNRPIHWSSCSEWGRL